MIPKRELRAFRVYSLPLLNHMFRATNRRFGHFGRQNLPIHISYIIQVVPGRAGGGSFKRKKNYIAKKEFAYRECAQDDRPLRCPNFFLRLNEAFAVAWL